MAFARKDQIKVRPFFNDRADLLRITTSKILLYIVAFAAIEMQTVWLAPKFGTAYYGIILFILIHHYLLAGNDPNKNKLLLLSVIPILRIISFGMPVGLVEPIYRYPMVGIPALIAVGLIIQETNTPWSQLGLQMPVMRSQEELWENILIGLSGIPLGLLGYYFADPIPLVIDFDLARVLASSFVVIFYVGLLEEIIFRGLILHTLKDCYGNVGILLSTGIYTILFSSYHSIEGILLMGIVSLLYSWHVLESKSILAVTISHIFMIGGMVILWPIVF